MGLRRVAVVGAGMTKFVRRSQETGRELAWEAVSKALESCEMTLDQIDCVVMGTAPDAFDGVHMKSEWLADGAGAWGKPYMRGYVGGGTGVFAPAQGGITWHPVCSIRAWWCAKKKCRPRNRIHKPRSIRFSTTSPSDPLGPNLLWIFAIEMNAYMNRYGLKKEDIALVSVKNKRNAADHPPRC
jgi:acetyl-CoA C-acetyltransferase